MNETRITVQQIVGKILSAIGIRKVVSIDDFYATADSCYEDAVTLFQTARLNKDVEYGDSIPQHILDAEESIWTRQLRSFWFGIEPDARLAILGELAAATEYRGSLSDVRDLSLLRGLIPEGLLVALSPDDWDRKREGILSEARADHRILCLFDQDLHMVNRSEAAGIALLQQALNEQGGESYVICGLLTQTLGKNDETRKAREFAEEFKLSLDQFLPLSKDRLRGDPMEFADGLKMTILNYARERLSRQVRDLTEQASEEAQRQMNDIDVYDFEHIVIRSSEGEGVWEPDTLFRLFDLFRYNAFKTEALDPEKRTSIYGVIEGMRAIRNIKTLELQQERPSDEVHKIRHIELFEDADSLNPAHQPIDLGDIFEVGLGQYYILLTQPCDLMIRSSRGKRGVKLACLVQISALGANQEEPKSISSFQLDHFDGQLGQRTYVKFRNSFQISLAILDLAAFNDDGKCRISLSGMDGTGFSTLHVPWRRRFEVLQRLYQSTHKEFAKIPYHQASNYQKKALKYLLVCSNKDVDLQYDVDGTFEFGIRRIARLRRPLSVELLSAYFSFLSRNPREHDFTRTDGVC